VIGLPAFEYQAPRTIGNACGLLADFGPTAMVVAGGTDLFPKVKRRQMQPKVVVDLSRIEGLSGIRNGGDGAVVIGALTSLRQIVEAKATLPTLAATAAQVASPQIRNAATIGGNLCVDTRCSYFDQSGEWRLASGNCLKDGGDACTVAPRGERCWAVSSSDLAPVVVALDATVVLVSARGEREVSATDLYNDDGIAYLTKLPDEIMTEIRIPLRDGRRSAYSKLRRRGAIDFPILGTAAAVQLDEEGVCSEARIVIGAVASAPFRVAEAEELLVGSRLTGEVIEETAAAAARPVRPQANADLGSRYRKWMASVYMARTLRSLQ
jgi:4-hydroxybenzoyl-CoA reductase subunit beta